MSEPKQPDNVSKNKADDARNTLGINRAIYAAGYSAKDGAIWFLGITAALIGIFTLGKNTKPIAWAIEKIDEGHKWWKKTRFGGMLKGNIVAPSLFVASVISHFAMGPGAVFGWRKANEAVNKYASLVEEKEQIIKANVILAEDNDRLKAKLAGQEQSFTERLAAQQANDSPAQVRA